jgi:CBS domain-containing protein
MEVREIMTENPASCTPETTLQQVAQTMVDCDCGEIPIVDQQRKLMGVVTDRDIACRAVAKGKDPSRTKAEEIMSSPAVSVTPQTSVEECSARMEENQIRRIPVVDASGVCCGIVSQADIARALPEHHIGQTVRAVSQPTQASSNAGRA